MPSSTTCARTQKSSPTNPNGGPDTGFPFGDVINERYADVGGLVEDAGVDGLVVEPVGGVLNIRFDRPTRRNALTDDIVLALTEFLRKQKVVSSYLEFYGEGAAALAGFPCSDEIVDDGLGFADNDEVGMAVILRLGGDVGPAHGHRLGCAVCRLPRFGQNQFRQRRPRRPQQPHLYSRGPLGSAYRQGQSRDRKSVV